MEKDPSNNSENTNQEPTGADILANMPSFEEMRKQVQQAHEQVSSGNTAGSQAEKEQQAKADREAWMNDWSARANEKGEDPSNEAQRRAEMFKNGDF